ncbi:recombinase family protein [Corynebacterium argentoratense]|uniref:recombinase family protein n=1 Tax=Corynebacterium argentoratense TaxID=42817 RepID=UPI0006193733|nr:recombinase family protein [Corynebacterium argentoratense]
MGPVEREFVDELSARSRATRPGLEACIAYLRDGDTLKVASIDRLARSLVDLRGLIDEITGKGAEVEFLSEGLTFSPGVSDPRSTLLLGVLGSFAEFERAIIRERQAEGIALAKKAGKYKGRQRALTRQQADIVREQAKAGASPTTLAKEYGVSRSTVYRALAREENS